MGPCHILETNLQLLILDFILYLVLTMMGLLCRDDRGVGYKTAYWGTDPTKAKLIEKAIHRSTVHMNKLGILSRWYIYVNRIGNQTRHS